MMMSVDMDYRDRIYERYVKTHQEAFSPASLEGMSGRKPLLHDIIKRYFPKDKRAVILDLGCGFGAFMHACREFGYENVTGVDRSPEQVKAAKNLGIERVEQGDLMHKLRSLPDASQDVVISFDVIEHFNRKELIPLVDQVFRVLKSGGKWVVHVPNGESPFGGRIYYGDFTHELIFTRTSIAQLSMASGFSRVTCEEDAPIPHGVKSSVRWMLWKVLRNLLWSYLVVETGSLHREHIFSQNLLAVVEK